MSEILVLVGLADNSKIGAICTNKRQSIPQSTNGSHRFQRCKFIQLFTRRLFLLGGSTHEQPGDKLLGAEQGSRQVHFSFINKDEDMQIAGAISTCTNKTTTLNLPLRLGYQNRTLKIHHFNHLLDEYVHYMGVVDFK